MAEHSEEIRAPYYEDDRVTLYLGDCLDVLRSLADCSVEAVVTDPPYGLGFMGRDWDDLPPGVEFAAECLRVLKPGGHMLAFGGSRTWHRLACAIEDAGFEVRDSIAWLYGSGFPKSLNVSKAIDKAAGADYETAPATPDAERWNGWGTALKPAFEPIVVARKPLTGTVAQNVLQHGTGALNIDATRVGFASEADRQSAQSLAELRAKGRRMGVLGEPGQGDSLSVSKSGDTRTGHEPVSTHPAGRWPTNVLLDDSQAAELDRQSGVLQSGANPTRRGTDKFREVYGDFKGQEECVPARGADSGGASRFFPTFRYEAKAPTDERPRVNGIAHPTVKPLDLMRWLVRLVTPPGGTVLEPFAGSGTTAEACVIEGFHCIAIEREASYLPLIVARLSKPIQPAMFGEPA